MVANAVTQGLFKTNLWEFATGRVDGEYKPGRDGSWTITLPELLGAGPGGVGGMYGSTVGGFTGAVSKNFGQNWFNMMGQVILIPIIGKAAQKFLRKPVLNPANKVLKMAGITDVKL